VVDPTAGRSVGRAVLLWLPVAAWAALIFLLSSESEPPDPAGLSGRPGWSQAAHFGLYFVLGALLYRAFRGAPGSGQGAAGSGKGAGTESGSRAPGKNPGRTLVRTCMLALAAGAVYAATDELHQYFVPSRQMDAVDWLVDLAGVLAGSVSALALERWRAGP